MSGYFRIRNSLLLAAFSCVLNLPAMAETTHVINDPYYGDTLFQFYQQHYFTSLTGLMVSQHFSRVEHHSEEAELLRAGWLLSYGLHTEAGVIFNRLIEQGATPATRDRAWFYLAKIRYQRGYDTQAEQALGQTGNTLSPELQQERGLMLANLLMKRQAYTQAAQVLGALENKDADARYVNFNLGIAQIKAGNTLAGSALLDKLGQTPAEDEEYRSLRDRANLALGFAALADKQPQVARGYLERVRLNGPQASKALLGLGWSADAQNDARLALIPWLELAQRDVSDTAVLEAKIAVPYAYARLGAFGQSAQLYNQAIAGFAREDSQLSETIAAIESGKLIDELIASNPGEQMGWFWNLRAIPSMPHATHLSYVLAQNEFQEAFKNYRDLQFLLVNLQDWRDKLGVYDDMLANRRLAFASRVPQVTEQTRKLGIDALQRHYDNNLRLVDAAETAADGVALADSKQLILLERANSAQQLLATGNLDLSPEEIAAARQRVRLAQGGVTWQLAQDYPARLWNVRQQLQLIARQLEQARNIEAALRQAQHDEPARFDVFAQRIAAIAPRLDSLIPRVQQLASQQQQQLQELAIAELKTQQQRLSEYATQAKFAVAQLYDQGNVHSAIKPEAEHAHTP